MRKAIKHEMNYISNLHFIDCMIFCDHVKIYITAVVCNVPLHCETQTEHRKRNIESISYKRADHFNITILSYICVANVMKR